MWFKYGLKAQKLLAQGSALGMMAISKTPYPKGRDTSACINQRESWATHLLGDRYWRGCTCRNCKGYLRTLQESQQ